ncbi:unnamed protein product [Musa hybrid cultivar]
MLDWDSSIMDPSRAASTPSHGPPDDGGGPAPEFPAGLRVLLVDDDPTCLKILDRMLRKCLYDVTTCSRAALALSILREKKGWFDLVLSDVYMPDMDGFKLLEHIGLEMDLPVIMMSADDHKDVVMKGVTHGACDYIIKPVRMESLKNIWQHVVRKKRNELKELENSGSVEEDDKHKRSLDDGDNASSGCVGNWKNAKRKKEEKDEEEEEMVEEHDDSSNTKKPRVVWSVDLHQQFVTAVNQLGVDKAVPKKILELMNVAGLTRENVASHLQKYRLYLRRVSVPQHHGRFDAHFASAQEVTYNSIGSVSGYDFQALAASTQLLPQNIAALHSGPRSATNTGMGVSAIDQIGFLSSGKQVTNSSNIISSSVQQINSRQMSDVHGPSNNIELNQLGQSQQVVQPFGSINQQFGEGTTNLFSLPSSELTNFSLPRGTINEQLNNPLARHMNQHGQQFPISQQRSNMDITLQGLPRSRGQLLTETACHDSRLVSALLQQVPPNNIPNHVSGRLETSANMITSLPANYLNASCSTSPQALYPDVHNSFITGLPGSCYRRVSSKGATPQTGSVKALSNSSNLKGMDNHVPNFDIIGEHHQNKSQDWKLQNVNLPYQSGQNLGHGQSTIDCRSSLMGNQDSTSTAKNGFNSNAGTVTKNIISTRSDIDMEKRECIVQHKTNLVENCNRVNYDGIPDLSYQDILFEDNIITNELMNVVRKQQQEGIGQVDNEFNFNPPV